MTEIYYLAGPMRHYPRHNFDAFLDAAKKLRGAGYTIISPAEMDLARGFNPDLSMEEQNFDMDAAMQMDFDAIMKSVGIIMLPGWERSKGAIAEFHLAQWRGLDKYAYKGDPEKLELLSYEDYLVTQLPFALDAFGAQVYALAVEKGWWDKGDGFPGKALMMHSEISEAAENFREGCPPDDKVPEYPGVVVEFGDTIIRILDCCKRFGWELGQAMLAKHEYNKTRSYRHGNKAF